jgi:Putative DnaT-like ssDNA binding protein
MAIQSTPEDGTGLADATAYISLAAAADFFEQTGRKAVWLGYTQDQRAAALNAAALYMDQVYRLRYVGEISEATAETQALLWPRDGVYSVRSGAELASTAIPAEIGRASAEFALALLQDGSGSLYGSNDSQAQIVTEKTVRVEGAVMKSEKYGRGGAVSRYRRYPLAEALLSGYVTPALSRVVRA